MNIKKSFNKKNLSRHHQNSDYKLSVLNIFQDNKEMIPNNNNSSNSKKKGGRPLTSNKKDMMTEPNGSVGKEIKEREEKRIKFDERKQLTKIFVELLFIMISIRQLLDKIMKPVRKM